MPGEIVLVIEDDEWVSRLLAAAIRDAGYEVVVRNTAKAGLEAASSASPDCIVCDIDLPDHDGYWVARNVRTMTSRVSVTPFLFLSVLDDQESRLQGFHVGADVYMTKPFRVDEVVGQVGALVQMAKRLRARRDSFLTPAGGASQEAAAEAPAIQGDLAQMSIATVLTVLEMERRTGVFEVVSDTRNAQLEIASGYVERGMLGGSQVSALAALRTMLGWKTGRFAFAPQPPRDPPPDPKAIGGFLLEAVRLEDETAAGDRSWDGETISDGPTGPITDPSPPSSGNGDLLEELEAVEQPPRARASRPTKGNVPRPAVRPPAPEPVIEGAPTAPPTEETTLAGHAFEDWDTSDTDSGWSDPPRSDAPGSIEIDLEGLTESDAPPALVGEPKAPRPPPLPRPKAPLPGGPTDEGSAKRSTNSDPDKR